MRAVIDAFENARSVDGWCQPAYHVRAIMESQPVLSFVVYMHNQVSMANVVWQVFQRATKMANEALHYFLERQDCEDFAAQRGLYSVCYCEGVSCAADS